MRILLAALLVALGAMISAPAQAADVPDYPDIEIPEVDYGLEGGFYLRGSAAWNFMWTQEHVPPGCGACINLPTAPGYGYSVGAGFGYETGTGLRVDGTLDYLWNSGLTDGTNAIELRSTVALANIYYDIPLSGHGAEGGIGAYLGAGAGASFYRTHVTGPGSPADGGGWTPTAAAMAGVTYDAGSWVADLGYRLLYMPTISNYVPGDTFYLHDTTVHEVRGTVRYRFH
jgi:hypothetical protein